MFDASSKIPVGVFASSYDDFGNFDECYDYSSNSGDLFYGKYCLGEMYIKVGKAENKRLEIVSSYFNYSVEMNTNYFSSIKNILKKHEDLVFSLSAYYFRRRLH